MAKTYVVDESAFDSPSPVRPGVYSGEIFDDDVEPGVMEAIKGPSFTEGLKAGLTAQPGEGLGHFIGAAVPSGIGATVGSVIPGVGTAIGATVGEAARQAAGAIVAPEETAKKSPLAIGAEVIGAGVGQKVGEAAGPVISKAAKTVGEYIKGATDWLSTRIGKQFIKASKKLNAYGHEPERALIDEGITATSWEELAEKVAAKKASLSPDYEAAFSPDKGPQYVNISNAVTPINKALSEARKYPEENAHIISKLERLKRDVIRRIRSSSVEVSEWEAKLTPLPLEWDNDIADTIGATGIVKREGGKEAATVSREVQPHWYAEGKAPKAGKPTDEVLEAELLSKKRVVPAREANNIKREINKLAKFTGNPSDDAAINKTKQYVAATINKEVEKVVPEISGINKRYANLIALENAVENRAVVAERNNLVGIPEFAATGALITAGLPAAVATEVGGRFIGTPTGATLAIKGLGKTPGLSEQITKSIGDMVTKFGGGISAATIQKGIETEAKDHPKVPPEYLPTLVEDEITKDPNFYNKERTPHHVKADYKAGHISKEEALKELRETHGFK